MHATTRADPRGEVTVAALGDSVTEADSVDFDSGDVGPGSWAASVGGRGVEVIGGWAHSGATTGDILAGASDVAADVLVVMGGTNDIRQGISRSTVETNLVEVVADSRATVVVLCTVVPSADLDTPTRELNAALPALSREHGWEYLDCAAPVRSDDGGWADGASRDGIHPTPVAAAMIGAVIRARILEMAEAGWFGGT